MRTHNYSCSRLFLPHLRDGLKCAGRGSFNLYTLYCLLKTVFDIANLIRERMLYNYHPWFGRLSYTYTFYFSTAI